MAVRLTQATETGPCERAVGVTGAYCAEWEFVELNIVNLYPDGGYRVAGTNPWFRWSDEDCGGVVISWRCFRWARDWLRSPWATTLKLRRTHDERCDGWST